MAIHRLLQRSAFGPADTKRMGDAYQQALKEIGLTDRLDPLTDILAHYIVEIAQDGEKDPARICTLAVERLRKNYGL